MKFDPNMRAVPYETRLLLRHREYGIGIGSVRIGAGRPNVSFCGFSEMMGHLGATMPSPIELEDMTGWALMVDDAPPKEQIDRILPALLQLKDAATFASVYGGEAAMTDALSKISTMVDQMIVDAA